MRGGMLARVERFFSKKSMFDNIDIVLEYTCDMMIIYVLQSISKIDTPSYFMSYDIEYAIWKNKLNGLCIQLRDDYREETHNNKLCIDNKLSIDANIISKVKSFFYKHLLIYITPKNQEEIQQIENEYKRMYSAVAVNNYSSSQPDRTDPRYSHISDKRKAELESIIKKLEEEYKRDYLLNRTNSQNADSSPINRNDPKYSSITEERIA